MAPSPSCTVLAPYWPRALVDADAVAAAPSPNGLPVNCASADAAPRMLDDDPAPSGAPPWWVSVSTWPGTPLSAAMNEPPWRFWNVSDGVMPSLGSRSISWTWKSVIDAVAVLAAAGRAASDTMAAAMV